MNIQPLERLIALAQQGGEDAAIAIQGVLILSQGLINLSPFQRVIWQLHTELCRAAIGVQED